MHAFSIQFWQCFFIVILSTGIIYANGLDKELAEAVAAGDIQKLKMFLEQGADINAVNKEGETALMVAALEGRTDMARFLIERGADLNAKDSVGATPLLYAALGGSLETIKLLIDKGSNLNARTRDGQTVLSISRMKGNQAAVELLEQAVERNRSPQHGK